jgi:transcriptional regulator with XRE-family HTH domain
MKPNDRVPHINVDFFEDLTGDIDTETRPGIEPVGQRIQSLRQEKGLSLEDVSHLTGFDIGFLADIESGETQPQLGAIIKLSKALDGAFSRLVSGVGEKLYSVTRKAERKIVSRSTSRKGKKQIYSYKSLAPEVQGRHMEALIVRLEEAVDTETSVHEGEEFIYVLTGAAVLRIGEEVFELESGDSVYYLSTTPHLISAKTGVATILAVLYEG